ncbi:MAG: NusA antitermination factor [Candidatus Kaiserbacteria bacterium GW2011_GWC2_49_12]|uniref:Transcription termination/antitermination protein NusA n=2 Tax=Candidatus Kaiseribacteriota TaxID=1752734 RepID=A0A0G1WFW8_9BACT|nr:MAG: NusA antitermination factor [Candidatus Kaiserbacteria bacterium GW2011_GWC2_49_12]KKW17683.1 MAG: NusA antitermination factor [Candidatus Kaiserbacteria bacterium GW2011_GWB1_50_17]HCM43401.1 transcription termination/antitermination protein NusA [Candidatus Kaiserbacteria bacterium]
MALLDLKSLNSALEELQQERGISRESVLEALETALAAAYRREYGKRGQIIRATFNPQTGDMEFRQAKIVVDNTLVRGEDEEPVDDDDHRSRFNPEQHIMIEDARRIKKDAVLDEEVSFPLEPREEFGRIAAQAAKQVIMQKVRESERASIIAEYGEREGEIVTGHVQRFERGNLYVDLGRATAILPYDEQIPGERYRQGERVRALLLRVDESVRGTFIRLTRSHPNFLIKLFEAEVPEMASGVVVAKGVVREPGSRAKIAVHSNDEHVDPVGSLVGQRGVRVAVVTSELGGEKIDVVEWSEDPAEYVKEALKPAQVIETELHEEENRAVISVSEDQQSLAIGRGGQNVRLAARLTGWKIDIRSMGGEQVAEATEGGDVEITSDAEQTQIDAERTRKESETAPSEKTAEEKAEE